MITATARRLVLRANALYLGLAALGGLLFMDLRGLLFARGPAARIFAVAPEAAIGFIEAHGLALILGVLLWRAASVRAWHLAAVAVHGLLGTANLAFWDIFVTGNALVMGYVTTALHWTFVILQLVAASKAPRSAPGWHSSGAIT